MRGSRHFPKTDGPGRKSCPLCGSERTKHLCAIGGRDYSLCPICGMVFLDPVHHLDPAAEADRYRNHRNSPDDPDYRRFLSRLSIPLSGRLPRGAEGLDYGCGPGPTLSVMMEEDGFKMRVFDPIFAPDETVLSQTYDFITCTETAEHFREPGKEFERLRSLLKPRGWLGVMTEILEEEGRFQEWYYHRDPTHICFYQRGTMEWIGRRFGWTVEFPSRTVVLFRDPPSS